MTTTPTSGDRRHDFYAAKCVNCGQRVANAESECPGQSDERTDDLSLAVNLLRRAMGYTPPALREQIDRYLAALSPPEAPTDEVTT